MRFLRRLLAASAVSLTVVPTGLGMPGAASAEVPPVDPIELLETYAPVLVVRTQTQVCGDGEPYLPVSVDAVLGSDDVVLRLPDGTTVSGPTADDLAAASPDSHIDIPGAALRPGCSYERWNDGLDAEPTTYARIVEDPEHPGLLVAQYWFFYVYNDWNDRHEGDWEMVQLVFDTAEVDLALERGPVQVAYAQHEGAEVSPWDDGQLRVDGTHPLVFVGQGSHASYFSSQRWFGASAQSGFGCDDTRPASTRVRPQVEVIDGDDEAWLSFEGRWGEKQPSFNNGPTGPRTKTQWASPVQWIEDEGRDGAVSVPSGGTTVTDFFCSASRAGSVAFMRFLDRPFLVGLALLVAAAVVVFVARRTRWRGAAVDPVVQRRAAGQTLVAALGIVRSRWRTFAAIGSLQIVVGFVVSLVLELVEPGGDPGDVVEVPVDRSVVSGITSLALGVLVVLPAAALVATASTIVVRSLAAGTPVTARTALSAARRRGRALAVQVVTVVAIVATFASVVLVPLGVWLVARWSVITAASLDGPSPWRTSARLSARRRRAALGLALVNGTVTAAVPPLVGTLVLIALGWSFATVNLLAGLVSALVSPASAVVMALFHADLAASDGASGDGSALAAAAISQD